MKRFTSIALALLCAVPALRMAPAHGADFPQRPISFIVPWAPGGPADLLARTLVESTTSLKQPVVIINKPGASGTIGTADAFRAKPDGYTILLADNISTVFQPRRLKLPYRGYQDFQAIIKLSDVPNVLVVNGQSTWKTLADFVAAAHEKSGLTVATAGLFTGVDLNAREFGHIAKIELQTIPSTGGTAEALTLLLGGHVDASVAAAASIIGHVSAGTLRPLAVFAKRRVDLLPTVPTTIELGYPTTMSSMFYVSAPHDVNQDALRTLHAAFQRAVTSPKWKEMAAKFGLLLEPLGPKELTAELAHWDTYFSTLARELNVQPQN
jgi:tripartite-type tricarboxylate transporter receptor subunit TctC